MIAQASPVVFTSSGRDIPFGGRRLSFAEILGMLEVCPTNVSRRPASPDSARCHLAFPASDGLSELAGLTHQPVPAPKVDLRKAGDPQGLRQLTAVIRIVTEQSLENRGS